MTTDKYPPNVGIDDCVILFDGVCKLCNAWSHFIIKYDTKYCFTLCSVQSPEGVKILKYFDKPTNYFETMLYVESNQCYEQSAAFLNIVHKLGWPWRVLCVFKIIPTSARNWVYDRIALNRYALFGKYNTCVMPSKENEHRFLSEK